MYQAFFSQTTMNILGLLFVIPIFYVSYIDYTAPFKPKRCFKSSMDTSNFTTPEEHENLVENNIISLIDSVKSDVEAHLSDGRVKFYVLVDTTDDGLLDQVALSVQSSLRDYKYKNAQVSVTKDRQLFIDVLGLKQVVKHV